KKEDTKKEDTKKEDTKKEDTKKEDTKKEDTKKELSQYRAKYWDNVIDFDPLFDFLTGRKCRYSAKNIIDIWRVPDILFEDEEIVETLDRLEI
ncbi:MAG: hypothetical protein PHG66_04765, partial [Candidatus Colwellbacteria bacterium]|nr:hypothetical protein [Candidatus Colwellbacteria bacterium]